MHFALIDAEETSTRIDSAIRRKLEFVEGEFSPEIREKLERTLGRRVRRAFETMGFDFFEVDLAVPSQGPEEERTRMEEFLRLVAGQWAQKIAELQTSTLMGVLDREFRILQLEKELGLKLDDPNFYG